MFFSYFPYGRHRIWFYLAVSWSFVCLCGGTFSAFAQSEVPYQVKIEGLQDSKLRSEAKSVSDTVGMKNRPPKSLRLLRRRADRDRERFVKLLRSKGYYGSQVGVEIDPELKPVQVTFHFDPGPVYRIQSVEINIEGSAPPELTLPEPEAVGLAYGKPLETRTVLDAESELLRVLKTKGYPFPRVADRRVVVDHAKRSASVGFHLALGPSAAFGPTTITGLKSVEESLIQKKIPWKTEDRFNADLFPKLRHRLAALGLFSTIRILPAETLDESGHLPVSIELTERKHRSIGAGVSYRTDERLGGQVMWEHRNLFGRGRRLRFSGAASNFTRNAEGLFRIPSFYLENQNLNLNARLAKDTPPAYSSDNLKSILALDREIGEDRLISLGIGFKEASVEQLGIEEDFRLFFLPAKAYWDYSDNLLDPSRGGRLNLGLTPFTDTLNTDLHFVKGEIGYRQYYPIERIPVVLAGRVLMGIIAGAERNDIPADERFYAGGGGSIRGYFYQTVGPLVDETPVGGKYLFEISGEIRGRISERLGLVAFLDGGSAFEGNPFDSGEKLLWGAGLGIRYNTPIGPLRLDIGFPLNRRGDFDDPFQVYINLGQAF